MKFVHRQVSVSGLRKYETRLYKRIFDIIFRGLIFENLAKSFKISVKFILHPDTKHKEILIGQNYGTFDADSEGVLMVKVFRTKNYIGDICTLAHELLHLRQFLTARRDKFLEIPRAISDIAKVKINASYYSDVQELEAFALDHQLYYYLTGKIYPGKTYEVYKAIFDIDLLTYEKHVPAITDEDLEFILNEIQYIKTHSK